MFDFYDQFDDIDPDEYAEHNPDIQQIVQPNNEQFYQYDEQKQLFFDKIVKKLSTKGRPYDKIKIDEFQKMISDEDHVDVNYTDYITGHTILHKALELTDDHRYIKAILNQPININKYDKHHNSYLMWAILNGRSLKIIKMIIDKNIDINMQNLDGHSALMLSMYNEPSTYGVKLVYLLIHSGANLNLHSKVGINALMLACMGKAKIDFVKLLVSNGANIHLITNLEYDSLGPVSLTAFDYALKFYKTSEYDENVREVLKFLVDNGYNINTNNKHINGKMNMGSYLIVATIENDIEVVKLLIELGIDVNLQEEYRYTALMIAISLESVEIVRLLLDAGSDIYIKNSKYQNSIDLAKMVNNSVIVDMVTDHEKKLETKKKSLMLEKIKKHDQKILEQLLKRKELKNVDDKSHFKRIYDNCHIDPDPLIYIDGNDFTEIALNQNPNSRLLESVIKIGQNCYTAEFLYNWWKTQVDKRLPVTDPLTRQLLTEDDKQNIMKHMKKYDHLKQIDNPDKIQIKSVGDDVKLLTIPFTSTQGLQFWQLQIVTPTNSIDLGYIPDYTGATAVNGSTLIASINLLWDNNRLLENVDPLECCRIHLRKPIQYWTNSTMYEWAEDIQRKIDMMMDEIDSHR